MAEEGGVGVEGWAVAGELSGGEDAFRPIGEGKRFCRHGVNYLLWRQSWTHLSSVATLRS